MPTHHTPGVYFEWQDRRFGAVSLARADIAGFVGIAVRGPLGRPVPVESWNQFTSVFGSHTPAGYLAFAVEGFFTNGGRRCWVVRVASSAATSGEWNLSTADGKPALTLRAASPGTWAKQLAISIIPLGLGLFTLTLRLPDGSRETWRNLDTQTPFVDLPAGDGTNVIRVSLNDSNLWQSPPLLEVTPQAAGAWLLAMGSDSVTISVDTKSPSGIIATPEGSAPSLDLQLLTADSVAGGSNFAGGQLPAGLLPFTTPSRFAGVLLNDTATGSNLVTIEKIHAVPTLRGLPVCAGGTDGLLDLTSQHFEDGLATLAGIDEVAVLAIPDILDKPEQTFRTVTRKTPCTVTNPAPLWPGPAPGAEIPPSFGRDNIMSLQQSMVEQCTLLKDRFAILDPPSVDDSPEMATTWRNGFTSPYAACYYPWLLVPDPLGLDGLVRAAPPSGHVAGIFARVEKLTGVHKPPANEIVEGAEDVTAAVDDTLHGLLNDDQVNVIRPFQGRRVRVAGARTVSDTSDWRFVNVRRLFIAIERSIRMNLQWIVFEPNNPRLWLQIDRAVRSFLESLWTSGFLDGESRDAAYSVTCDATTNPPSETDNGRVICEIGALPPWPAEFVVVRIGITDGGVEMLTSAEAQVA